MDHGKVKPSIQKGQLRVSGPGYVRLGVIKPGSYSFPVADHGSLRENTVIMILGEVTEDEWSMMGRPDKSRFGAHAVGDQEAWAVLTSTGEIGWLWDYEIGDLYV